MKQLAMSFPAFLRTGKTTAVLLLAGVLTFAGTALAAQAASMDRDLDDADIALAVDGELLVARGVSSNDIDVTSNDGVVTLTGTVSNILAKDRAEAIASKIKGVRSVVNRIEVEPTERSDTALARAVESALASDPATEDWEIQPAAEDGRVTLTGVVDSWREKQLAERVAKGVAGVRGIDNRLEISSDTYRTDAEIKAEIEAAHKWDVRINDALIETRVDDGDVSLSGTVGSAYEKTLAAADAWVPGVKSVSTDDLKVEWWARDSMLRMERYSDLGDEEIRQAVKDAMLYDPRVASFEPEVIVDGGIVTLTGVVDNVKAKRAAAQDARNTAGVWRVRNHLKVRPVEERTDEAVETALLAELAQDPYVESFEIDVNVDGGTARLRGTVDSYFEKWQAGDVAARVAGVVDVENRLRVDYEPLDYEVTFYDWDPVGLDVDLDRGEVAATDWEIHQDIESELFWSPFVDADQVAVTVDDGVATLTGTVDSWEERTQATEEALEGGAVIVDNDLEVEWGPDIPFL